MENSKTESGSKEAFPSMHRASDCLPVSKPHQRTWLTFAASAVTSIKLKHTDLPTLFLLLKTWSYKGPFHSSLPAKHLSVFSWLCLVFYFRSQFKYYLIHRETSGLPYQKPVLHLSPWLVAPILKKLGIELRALHVLSKLFASEFYLLHPDQFWFLVFLTTVDFL